MPQFSDYIVFADESGDHGLTSIDAQFPVFTLAFCIVAKDDYQDSIVPAFHKFKFEYWGHDAVVLHEHELRKSEGDFAFLRTNAALRARFMDDVSDLMTNAPFEVYATTIDKEKLQARYANPWNPYEVAMQFQMEYLLSYLQARGQRGRTVHVLFESRGKKEDRDLELEFRRVCANGRRWGWRRPNYQIMTFEPVFVPKNNNSIGLQMADLVARPIALKTMRPRQQNRAYDLIRPKLRYTKVFPV
ncbi:MAG: DUF3800 domain-containing protein [Proteobacteria bacterium]|nr:MAG: DUF3800 domain-containing protein [Pseudomonadota bacterium]